MKDSQFGEQLRWLRETIPTAKRRRTARGVLRTCRELAEHRDLVSRLLADAETKADRRAIDELIADIEARRDELTDKGRLRQQVNAHRSLRAARRAEFKKAMGKTGATSTFVEDSCST